MKKTVLIVSTVTMLAALAFFSYEPSVDLDDQQLELGARGFSKGNMNGIKLSIPTQIMDTHIEYKQAGAWALNRKHEKRTWDDQIRAFSIKVNQSSLISSSEAPAQESAAGVIGVVALDNPNASLGGWGRLLRSKMERLSANKQKIYLPPEGKRELTGEAKAVSVRYEVKGFDPGLSLNVASPVGEGVRYFSHWNLVLYWSGSIDGHVGDLIECYNGEIPLPDQEHRCTHYFVMEELGAKVLLKYRRDDVKHWREMKSRARALILDFRV